MAFMTPWSDVLDAFPLDWSDQRVQGLHRALAASIFRDREIEQIVVAAGVSPADVGWSEPAWTIWYTTMNIAAGGRALRALVTVAVERLPALQDRIEELLAAQPLIEADIDKREPEALAPDSAAWRGFSGSERQIVAGDETMLDIAYLQLGLERAAAVCRLTVAQQGGFGLATGFRVGPRHLLTNHHVLYDWTTGDARALSVEAAFGFELDVHGALRTSRVVQCDVATIVGEREHDFALVTMAEPLPADIPALSLAGPQQPVRMDDRVVVIQHPAGMPKKIALAHNLVRHVDDEVIQYWTDTDAGSSGSPVFDERWDLVALHHQWVSAPAGDDVAFRNQGRNINRVAQRIADLGIDLGEA